MNKAGYNKNLDSVVICPKGSVGDTIEIEGLKITLPKKPPKTKIYKRSPNPKYQYWERDKTLGYVTLNNAEENEAIIDEQHRILREGYWFYNNGEPEYITGAHWLLLQWAKTEATNVYFDFRKAHQKLFIFFEACYVDQRSLGAIMGKSRRSGITHIGLIFEFAKSLLTERNNFGMTSMNDTYAAINFGRFYTMLEGMPFWFKPVHYYTDGKIEYNQKLKGGRTRNADETDRITDMLANTVTYMATRMNSYDSTAQKVYLADELSKWDERENILLHFVSVKSTLTKGAKTHGKIYIVSTIRKYTGKDPYETKDAKNGDRYAAIYKDSKLDTRNSITGRTKSGLYKIFIPAQENLEGYIDRYGYPIIEAPDEPVINQEGEFKEIGAIDYINAEYREKYKDNPGLYNEYKREYPMSEDDMFVTDLGNSSFDTARIDDQIDHNNVVVPDKLEIGQITRFNLAWKDGNVIKNPHPRGRFTQYYDFPDHLANNVSQRGGMFIPENTDIGRWGVDPYKQSGLDGSKQSMSLFTLPNPYGIPANSFLVRYSSRRENLELAVEDAIMAFHYYGCPALIERNIRRLLETMKERGYRMFAMNRADKPPKYLNADEKEYGGQPKNSEDTKQMMLFAIESFIVKFVGTENNENVLDNELLLDWRSLDINNWEKFDDSVSSSLAIMACNNVAKAKPEKKQSNKDEALKYLTKKYRGMDKI